MVELNTRLLVWLSVCVLTLLLLSQLQAILGPFAIAALYAYLGDPLADRLELYGLSRTKAVSIVFGVMTLVMALGIVVLIPMIAAQFDLLREVFPGYIAWFKQTLLPYLQSLTSIEQEEQLFDRMQALLADNWNSASDIIVVFLQRISQSGMAIVAMLGSAVLVPVVTFYLMRDWDKLMAHIADLLPRKDLPLVQQLASECDEVLGAFLRGQLVIMIILGILYAVGLAVLGLDLALLVGMVAGLASVVPYLGAIVGILTAAIATLVQFHDPVYLIGVAVVFGLGQLLESLYLTPVLVGDRIGLHPVAVIFAVMAGGQLFGFIGVLLALPMAAVLMVVLRHAHHSYKSSVFYHED